MLANLCVPLINSPKLKHQIDAYIKYQHYQCCTICENLIIFTSFLGIAALQAWTRESLKTRPFCLAIGKDWTLRPSKIDLREIHTELCWARKHRKVYEVKEEKLKDITELLNDKQLRPDGPVRILVQGKKPIMILTKYA